MCTALIFLDPYNALIAQNREFTEKEKHKARPIT
jgi:hypothetical protein